jgi:hypothetical protein
MDIATRKRIDRRKIADELNPKYERKGSTDCHINCGFPQILIRHNAKRAEIRMAQSVSPIGAGARDSDSRAPKRMAERQKLRKEVLQLIRLTGNARMISK